jgi:type I restriction enzyme S subunit
MSKYKRYERYKDSGVEWIGEIPEHWDVIKLKFLSTIFKGKNPRITDEWREEFLLIYLWNIYVIVEIH